jgi:transcriptional regulator with XRE-family HTH domain
MLAVDAGIDRTYVSRLERGLENPAAAVLEKLARAFSSNIEELFRVPRAEETAQ